MGVIYEYCGGIPRKVNKVAMACLMTAPGQNEKLIDSLPDYLPEDIRQLIEKLIAIYTPPSKGENLAE